MQSELLTQLLLQDESGRLVGVGEGVGDGEGDGVNVGVAVGDGVAVAC